MKKILRKITPRFLIGYYHFLLSFLGALVFFFPSRKIKVIGVTGTSGKSTVVSLISLILPDCASLSSIRFKIKDKEWKNMLKMTMPGPFIIQSFLKKAVKEKCKYAVIEVTSEGIKQFRHKFINFDTAVFTNLSPEHIESHGSFENYKREKSKLFRAAKNIHIVNSDDENSESFLKEKCRNLITFGINSGDIKAENPFSSNKGISFKVEGIDFNLDILGAFNIYNALAAISVAKAYSISFRDCSSFLKQAKPIPGRMEIIAKDPFSVVVDYAITPVALEKVYSTLGTNLICVLGSCGGGRDKWKRSVFGEIAAKHCKEVIITNEDPYDEDPLQIIENVAKGAKGKAIKILDRKEAIRKAVSLAKPGDTVIITGKGCEPWMCVANDKKIPWDDRQIAREALRY